MDEELTPIERFMLVQAIYSRAAEAVSTKGDGNMRSKVDDAYRAEYDRTGGKSFTLRFLGERVGTYSISESKGTPDRVTRGFEVTDQKALASWFPEGEESALVDQWLTERWPEFARWYFERTGELPDGCDIVERVSKGKVGGRYMGGSLRGFDAGKVLDAATRAGLLAPSTVPLLGGGTDGR